MDLGAVIVVTLGIIAYGMASARLQGTVVTAPLLFVAYGFVMGPGGLGLARIDLAHGLIHLLAELTLVLVLFSDAARIDLVRLRRDHDLPQRMLLVGLPLIVVAGAVLAAALFPGLSLWEAALLGAILAPTDAALGQAVVSDKSVPVRIRQALNVESGLNDGIALPLVLLFAALAHAMAGEVMAGEWLVFGLLQVTLGPLAGVAVGLAGAWLLGRALRARWIGAAGEGMAVLALALLAFAAAESIGGNGFIAAFSAGLVFGNRLPDRCTFLLEFMETEGRLLTLLTFLVFGAAMLPAALHGVDWRVVLYALLSLTVVRAAPIALSLAGARLHLPSVLFLGWFGPRGLASVLFALLILEDSGVAGVDTLLTVTLVTVLFSVVLHGVSAAPLARRYARAAARLGDCEERRPVSEMPLRHR